MRSSGYERYLDQFDVSVTDQQRQLPLLVSQAYKASNTGFFGDKFQKCLSMRRLPPDPGESGVKHHVGRLGSSMRAAKHIARIAICHPELFANFDVHECLAKPLWDRRTLPAAPASLGEIADLIGESQPELCENVLAALNRRNVDFETEKQHNIEAGVDSRRNVDVDILSQLKKAKRDADGRLKVHCEIPLLEDMHATGAQFFGNDRFIGCSKSACFCCYHYIVNHPGGFVPPPCHMKTWLKWNLPDAGISSLTGGQVQDRVLQKVLRQLRKAALKALSSSRTDPGLRPDSTAGITDAVRSRC